ncbi:MAG: sulfotransferase, partial [Terriglobia bacterium]
MSVRERLFAPPDADATKIEERQAGLPPALRELIQVAGAALEREEMQSAGLALGKAAQMAPSQPDILRMGGLLLAKLGQIDAASASFEEALRQAPDDALIYHDYAQARESAGDVQGALRLRERGIEKIPESPLAWYDYGDHRFRHVGMESAIEALGRSVALDPCYAPATLRFGNAMVYAGRIEEGTEAFRRTLQKDPSFGAAWYSLANIKTVRFKRRDMDQMRNALRGSLGEGDRIAIEFALAKACEDEEEYEVACELLSSANARKRRHVNWNADRFSAQVELAERLFAAPHASAANSTLGREAIFIVGMPRSGTTLTEQIIASHSCVAGANELGDLGRILGEESARRQQHYPEWIPHASSEDWQRLGQHYLDSTAHWRRDRPRSTDKMPTNWLFLGAIRAMLP